MIRSLLAAAAATGWLPASAEDWSGQITPYVWAAGLGGEVTPMAGAPTISFDKGFSDLLKDLDGAFFLSGCPKSPCASSMSRSTFCPT